MNDAPAMSDAPAMPQEQADDAEDRFIQQVLFEAIRQQKLNARQPRNPGQYTVSEAVQEELSQLKPLKRMAKAIEREFKKDNINDAPHANPTSMSTQVPAQVAAATTTPSSKPTANKSLSQIDRVPTATNVRSFIERYKVDRLNVAEVKERFGLNDLDRERNGKLASRVTSARGAAKPYKPLFETLQHLIEIKRCFSPDEIQDNMVATLGQTRSIRVEFKRMANILAGVDGVENRADALKKAWNVPDPK